MQLTQSSSHSFKSLVAVLLAVGALGLSVQSGAAQAQAAAANPAAATTANKGPVTINLTQQKVVPGADGKETLADASRVKPGDMVEYRATYSVQGQKGVRNLVATLPIPKGMDFTNTGTLPAAPLASLDEKTYAPMPLKRKVRDAKGVEQEVSVPLSEYRSLRWRVAELNPGQNFVAAARVRVSNEPTPVDPLLKVGPDGKIIEQKKS